MFAGIKSLFSGKKSTDPTKTVLSVKENDVFLVSYPKSGNTWTRFLVGNYMTKGKMDFKNGHLMMPDVHYNPQDINKVPFEPRFIKSHYPFRKEYKKVVYVVRDGRDTAVSYYFFLRKLGAIPETMTFPQFLTDYFFAGKSEYGHWDSHVFSWIRDQKNVDLLLIKYEDMLANSEEALNKILRFAGVAPERQWVELAAEKASFKEMQKDEKENAEFLKTMGHDNSRVNYGFIREGKQKNYLQHFSDKESEEFWNRYGAAMELLGYQKQV